MGGKIWQTNDKKEERGNTRERGAILGRVVRGDLKEDQREY